MNILFLTGVVISYAVKWGIHVDISDPTSPEYTPLVLPTVYVLAGTLCLGLFIHNAIITITGAARYPENNVSGISEPRHVSRFKGQEMTLRCSLF